MPHLILLLATPVGESARSYSLGTKEITIGRGDGADIQIIEKSASRLHARLGSQDGEICIWDLGTKNGTYVNGVSIREHLLKEGDIITIGRSQFIYTAGEWVDFIEQDVLGDTMGDHSSKLQTELLSIEALANEIASLTQKLSLIYWMSRIIQEEVESSIFLRKSLICLLNGIRAHRGSIYLHLPPQGLVLASQTQIQPLTFTPYPRQKKLVLQSYSQGKGIICRERANNVFYTLVCVPLKARQKITGILYLESLGRHLYIEEDLRFLNIASNIFASNSENRRLIQNLRKTQKNLEEHSTFGEIVSCIAHELKNPLTSASGFCELLLRDEPDSQKHRRLEYIERELNRSVKIIENMLNFARKREPSLALEDLNQVLKETLERKKASSSPGIVFVEALAQGPLMTQMDELQMDQVLTNILNNAEESILEGTKSGKIYIKTWRDESSVFVSIRDTGQGISPEARQKLFQAFFTTKAEGTGLGLSLCQHIIQAHFGQLSLENTRDGQGGTDVVIQLPLSNE